MAKFSKSTIKIAIFSLVALFILIWGINYLQGFDIFKKYNKYYVIFDRTDGLLASHSVVINGVIVGTVDKIELMTDNNNKVLVRLNVERKVKIPDNTTVQITSPSLLSSPQVEFFYGTSTTNWQDGDTVIGLNSAGIFDGIDDLLVSIKSTVVSLDTICASVKGTIQSGALDSTMHNIASITEEVDQIIAANRGKINGIVTDFNTFTSNISRNDQKIDSVINNLDKISTKLAGEEVSQAITNVSSAIQHLDSVLALMENGTGTLGKLSTNDSLYNNLKNSLESLDLLLKDLKANPKKYINVTVFGKKEKSVAKKED